MKIILKDAIQVEYFAPQETLYIYGKSFISVNESVNQRQKVQETQFGVT
jgi:hypothetical protein